MKYKVDLLIWAVLYIVFYLSIVELFFSYNYPVFLCHRGREPEKMKTRSRSVSTQDKSGDRQHGDRSASEDKTDGDKASDRRSGARSEDRRERAGGVLKRPTASPSVGRRSAEIKRLRKDSGPEVIRNARQASSKDGSKRSTPTSSPSMTLDSSV